MARVIAVVSQKGGVGKTTSAVNLAAAFAREGREVLLVEVDPQGAVLPSVGLDDAPVRHGLLDVLRDEQLPALDAVLPTAFEGMSVMPAVRPDLEPAHGEPAPEMELERIALSHPTVLREVIDQVGPRFDVVLLDGSPTLGPLLHLCLAAADSYLVPVQAEEYAYRTLRRLLATADQVRDSINPELECEGLLLTMVDLRTRMSVRVINQLHENFGDKVLVSMVPRTVSLQEMPVRGKPTVVHAASSKGGRAYDEVAQELLTNFDAQPISGTNHTLLTQDEQPLPASELARRHDAAVSDTRTLEEIGEETMFTSFPSTGPADRSGGDDRDASRDHGNGAAHRHTANASPFDDDLFEAWGDDEQDRSLH